MIRNIFIMAAFMTPRSLAFLAGPASQNREFTSGMHALDAQTESFTQEETTRRKMLEMAGGTILWSFLLPQTPAVAEGKSFAPGGTLVDYEVGVTVGNDRASKSRRPDNSNVLFTQDYYFKFGTAAPWILGDSTEFPKSMPFTPAQQRYDALKKYRERIERGIDVITALRDSVEKGEYGSILGSDAGEYAIRPMGLLANTFLASENTGVTNELLLARWYINEIYLDVGDIKNAASKESARESFESLILALNSFLSLLNRVITPKVGEKWKLILSEV